MLSASIKTLRSARAALLRALLTVSKVKPKMRHMICWPSTESAREAICPYRGLLRSEIFNSARAGRG
jgi:hypothetical protein